MTTAKEQPMNARPISEISNEIHQDITRRNYELRQQQAREAEISVENRNLSLAWSFRNLHEVK